MFNKNKYLHGAKMESDGMYFVDRQVLEQRLQYMEQLGTWLESLSQAPQNRIEQLAFERAIHMVIEVMLDIGNQMIDGFIMRDPGSYEDILLILEDEKVISLQEKDKLTQFIQCRKALVSEYMLVDHASIWFAYQQARESLQLFPAKIRAYLNEQLGPVSAFTPHQGD